MATSKKTRSRTGFYLPPDILIPMVERLQQGETTVEEEIKVVFEKKFYGHIFKKTGNHDATDLLLKVIFKEIEQKITTLREPAAFVGWSNKIVIAKCNDYLRKKYSREKRKQKDLARRVEPAYKKRKLTDDEKSVLRTQLELLPPKQAEIMRLYYIDSLSVNEISTRLEIPEGTVKSRLHYGRRTLWDISRPPRPTE